VVETTRQRAEDYKQRPKEHTLRETKPNKNRTAESTIKEKDNEKEHKKDYHNVENKKDGKRKNSKDKRFSSTKEGFQSD
jgi:hypothetical protein